MVWSIYLTSLLEGLELDANFLQHLLQFFVESIAGSLALLLQSSVFQRGSHVFGLGAGATLTLLCTRRRRTSCVTHLFALIRGRFSFALSLSHQRQLDLPRKQQTFDLFRRHASAQRKTELQFVVLVAFQHNAQMPHIVLTNLAYYC